MSTQTQDQPESRFSEVELEAIGESLPELRRSLANQAILRKSLTIAFGLGLVAHVAGYLLRPLAGTEFLGLAADLLYALGWSLWTGAVVVFFVEIFPASQRRSVIELLDAFDAARRQQRTS